MSIFRGRQIGMMPGLLFFVFCLAGFALCEEPEKITVCQLKNNPDAYNRKLIEVTGFVSHGFEDFTFFDPNCPDSPDIWLEYGGTVASGTMYCCGVTDSRTRSNEIVVENIPIPLIDDKSFREFDRLIQHQPDSIVHATVVGRYFAGQKSPLANGEWAMRGYGHMGCCTLLAIQQIISVDPHERDDLDYGAYPDQPDIEKTGCGFQDLMPISPYSILFEAQHKAELGQQIWAFDDPKRVALDALARLSKIDETSITGMRQTHKVQGRIVYKWRPKKSRVTYMIVVSRPYWLSFYSKDAKKIAWVALAVYESSCD